MGALLFKAVAKTGTDELKNKARSLLELSAKDIDGSDVALADICMGKKCIMVVNVATN